MAKNSAKPRRSHKHKFKKDDNNGESHVVSQSILTWLPITRDQPNDFAAARAGLIPNPGANNCSGHWELAAYPFGPPPRDHSHAYGYGCMPSRPSQGLEPAGLSGRDSPPQIPLPEALNRLQYSPLFPQGFPVLDDTIVRLPRYVNVELGPWLRQDHKQDRTHTMGNLVVGETKTQILERVLRAEEFGKEGEDRKWMRAPARKLGSTARRGRKRGRVAPSFSTVPASRFPLQSHTPLTFTKEDVQERNEKFGSERTSLLTAAVRGDLGSAHSWYTTTSGSDPNPDMERWNNAAHGAILEAKTVCTKNTRAPSAFTRDVAPHVALPVDSDDVTPKTNSLRYAVSEYPTKPTPMHQRTWSAGGNTAGKICLVSSSFLPEIITQHPGRILTETAATVADIRSSTTPSQFKRDIANPLQIHERMRHHYDDGDSPARRFRLRTAKQIREGVTSGWDDPPSSDPVSVVDLRLRMSSRVKMIGERLRRWFWR